MKQGMNKEALRVVLEDLLKFLTEKLDEPWDIGTLGRIGLGRPYLFSSIGWVIVYHSCAHVGTRRSKPDSKDVCVPLADPRYKERILEILRKGT